MSNTANALHESLARLPGAELVRAGLADLADGRETVAAQLVRIGSPRLRACGIEVPVTGEAALEADRRLYRLLSAEHGDEAHSRYNALIRELVSFERALEQRLSREARRAESAA
jgi:hypothetical protein